MVKQLFTATACVTLLAGCYSVNTSQYPLPETYPLSYQQKMQAAHHWDVLAEHEAGLIARSVHGLGLTLAVKGGDRATVFDASYKNLLTSRLVQQGASVSPTGRGAANVTYEVNVVEHTDRDPRRAPPGAWTLLAGGIVVVAHAIENWSPAAKLAIPAAVGVDLYSGNWVSDSDTEVIVTTRVVSGDRIVHASSNIYYVNAGDVGHYAKERPPVKTISLTDQE